MKIWVDLVNSPQVHVLRPVIAEIERRGHQVEVTTRDFAQTVQLADQAGLRHVAIGRHGGANRLRAILVNLERARELIGYLRGKRFDLAVSHNSYSQAIAAWLLRIPLVTMMDYEHHQANHLAFRLATRVLVPSVFPEAYLRRFGAVHKAVRYPGLKEQLYLSQLRPDPDFLCRASLPADRPLVVVRPPGYWAQYYQGRGGLFQQFLDHALADPGAFVVFLPRIKEQAAMVADVPASKVLVPARALDGPNLLYYADIVASAGGTMNREAAVLGTPAYTVFEGLIGAVDAWLIGQGRLRLIQSEADIPAIRFTKKSPAEPLPTDGGDLARFVADAILEVG